MTNFFRNLWADLVDKRLWPVALVLVLAVIAVPVLLLNSGASDESVDVASNTAPGGAATSGRAVVAVDTQTKRVALTGSERDPFKQRGGNSDQTSTTPSEPGPAPPGSTPPTGATGSGTGATGSSGSTGATGSTGSDTSGTGSSGSGPSTGGGSGGGSGSGSGDTSSSTLVVRFGKENSSDRRIVAPMEALPSQSHPSVVYLGVVKGKAAFLISSDVNPADGTDCHPSADVCQKAFVAPGHKVKLTVGNGGAVTTYVIEVSSAGS
jgi:hypothetical protein